MKYFKINVLARNFSQLPPFIGSMLRGAFGVNLKDVVCINPSFECSTCFAKDNCIYYEFYEEKNRFHKFRFDFTLKPKKLDFSLYLFNEACQKYPYVLSALYRMLTQKGLGVNRKKYEIEKIYLGGEVVFENEFKNLKTEPKNFKCDEFCPKVKIRFVTPLRIKREGKFLRP
ncbi:hypothetical protein [Nitratiruptor sp. YY09-18]|uniref:hypothetical protein n=1 Tax=Nitratiruptor sp. YY09-18 TaxID=2724901 RepID=UPI0019150229|nr:hypothetical protein [Nitratiruptor sp. YY09-18]